MAWEILEETAKVVWAIDGLGKIRGWKNRDGSVQFYGVPYADLSERFRQSTLKTAWKEDLLDCTKLRGYCPQPHRLAYPFLLPDRPNTGEMFIDEFDCLNMQVTLPSDTKPGDKLPVFVYVHGGAFVFGTGNYSILDGKALASMSTQLGQPTIVISINYRCGFFGFLCSSDISEDNAPHSPGVGNYGLHDQKNAFLWINKYINSLGGDPGRVTIAGQSAGAASMDVHIRAPYNHLFNSVIFLSGTAPICGIYKPSEYEVLYFKLLTVLGIPDDLPGPQRLARLRQVPHEHVSAAAYAVFQGLSLPQFGISTDVSMLAADFRLPTPSEYPQGKLSFQGRIMHGDCLHEGIIYQQCYSAFDGRQVYDLVHRHLPQDFATRYLNHYDILPGMTAKQISVRVESLLSDSMFTSLPFFIADANPQSTFAYHFDQASTLDNSWAGFAHHSLDYMYVMGNITDQLDVKAQRLANRMSQDFIAFTNGIDPYPPCASGLSRTYGPDSACEVRPSPRPTAWFREMMPYMDQLLKLAADLNVRQNELISSEYGPGSDNVVAVPQLDNGGGSGVV